MKKILITGASGFLGGKAASYFSASYEVLTPTHKEMDITNANDVNRVIDDFRPDVIIHCAAMADIGQCEQQPVLSWERNVTGSINIASAAVRTGAKCLLCSSDQVYTAEPINLYAKEKMAAEQECLKINPDCVFLRLSWMYEPFPKEGDTHSDFVTYMLPFLTSEESLSFGTHEKRGLTDVNEVVANMEKAISLPGGIYDFGAPNEKTMYDTVIAVFEGLGLPTDRVKANEEEFADNPIDLTLKQDALNRNGIYFTDTTEALVRNFTKHLGQ